MTLSITRPGHIEGTAVGPSTTAPPGRTERDRSVDLVRALCLIAVVGLHALMVGVSVPDGAPRLENALESWDGFTVFSWFTQMMPLFFILGGFASARHYRRLRERGVTASGYVAARLERLLPVPLAAATATIIALGALAFGAPALGDETPLASIAGWRISQPLWFLGVYILCSALVPAMLRLHELAPRATLAGIGTGIAAVDAIRLVSGVDGIGFANLAFVWLFVQQLGFWLADGRAPGARVAGVAVGALVLGALLGVWPANLFAALNPPSAALALLGVLQFAGFSALRPRLARWAEHPVLRRASDAVNSRAMTIYSWHMLVTVLLAGGLLATGAHLPAPLSPEWWLSRPQWLAAVGLAVGLTVAAAARLERRSTALGAARRAPSSSASVARSVGGTLCGCSGVLVVLAANGTAWAWLLGAMLLVSGLLAVRGPAVLRRAPLHRGWPRKPAQNAKATPSSTP